MAILDTYKQIQEENKQFREQFNNLLNSGKSIHEIIVGFDKEWMPMLNEAEKAKNDANTLIMNAKYQALYEVVSDHIEHRSFFSWFIHLFRNLDENKSLRALEDRIKRNVDEDFKESTEMFKKIESGEYDEKGTVVIGGKSIIPYNDHSTASSQNREQLDEIDDDDDSYIDAEELGRQLSDDVKNKKEALEEDQEQELK